MRRHYRIFEFTVAGTDQWIVALEMDSQENHWRAVARCTSFDEATAYLDTLSQLQQEMVFCVICGTGYMPTGSKYCSDKCRSIAEMRARQRRNLGKKRGLSTKDATPNPRVTPLDVHNPVVTALAS